MIHVYAENFDGDIIPTKFALLDVGEAAHEPRLSDVLNVLPKKAGSKLALTTETPQAPSAVGVGFGIRIGAHEYLPV
jgi:hypothetical protein